MRKINKAGIDLIKEFESLSLEAYLCPAGVWTIGWGHTGAVDKVDSITEEQANKILENDLEKFEEAVTKNCRADLNDNQFAALVSFTFNAGIGALRSSTLLRRLNEGDYLVAMSDNFENQRNEFLKWTKVRNPKTKLLEPSRGLARRRVVEGRLFREPV